MIIIFLNRTPHTLVHFWTLLRTTTCPKHQHTFEVTNTNIRIYSHHNLRHRNMDTEQEDIPQDTGTSKGHWNEVIGYVWRTKNFKWISERTRVQDTLTRITLLTWNWAGHVAKHREHWSGKITRWQLWCEKGAQEGLNKDGMMT